jgi:hypothetical protein
MTTGLANQIAALQRIPTFSAAVRGHEAAVWYTRQRLRVGMCTSVLFCAAP